MECYAIGLEKKSSPFQLQSHIIIPDTSGMVATDRIVVSATALEAIS
jgi:hypothetical protein